MIPNIKGHAGEPRAEFKSSSAEVPANPPRCGISKERAPSTGLFKRQIKKCARWRPDTANDALHMVRTSESGIDDSFMSDHGKSPETPAFKADLGGD